MTLGLLQSRLVAVAALLYCAGVARCQAGPDTGAIHQDQRRSVTAKGRANIHEDDRATARREAISDALRAAVEQAIGTYVQSESAMDNFALVQDRILTRSKGFAVLRAVNWERVSPDGKEYQVEVAADVSSVPLVEALKELGLTRRWRVMVVVPEQHINRVVPDPAAETELIKQLLRRGFYMVDQKQSAEVRNSDMLRQIQAGDFEAAAAIGRRYGAEIVVTGQAFSQETGRQTGEHAGLRWEMVSCRARLECRAIRTDTAEIVSADGVHETGMDATVELASKKALAAAASSLAETLAKDLLLLPGAGSYAVQLDVSGFTRVSTAAKFEEALAKLPGVRRVTRREFAAGVDVLEVSVDAELYPKLSALLETHASMQEFGIQVHSDNKNKIIARAKTR